MQAILIIIVVLISIAIFNNTVKGGTKVTECSSKGGRCTSGTCTFKEVPFLAGKAAGCAKNELCCLPVIDEKSKDPACDGRPKGAYCSTKGAIKVCNAAEVCVSVCEYCAIGNAEDPKCNIKITQYPSANVSFKDFECRSLTSDDCKKMNNATSIGCIIGYEPFIKGTGSETAVGYCHSTEATYCARKAIQ